MNDKEMLDFTLSFREGILDGRKSEYMCAAVSLPLHSLLSIHGIDTEIIETDLGEINHVFLKLEDGRILDPTADQFNWCNDIKMPKVYLGPPSKIHGSI